MTLCGFDDGQQGAHRGDRQNVIATVDTRVVAVCRKQVLQQIVAADGQEVERGMKLSSSNSNDGTSIIAPISTLWGPGIVRRFINFLLALDQRARHVDFADGRHHREE